MITEKNRIFQLDTRHTSYIFRIAPSGQPEHIYYGGKLPEGDYAGAALKNNAPLGSTVCYEDSTVCLDSMLLEYSGIGRGDYRHSPLEVGMPDGSYVTDFVYNSYEICPEPFDSDCGLPFAQGPAQTLYIHLKDKKYPALQMSLVYTVFSACDVIARNTVLSNGTQSHVTLHKIMSAMLEIPTAEYQMLTLNGSWAKETHVQEQNLPYGLLVNDSTVGASSNRHNPAFLLKAKDASHSWGEVLGFNLIYSGNHYSAVEKSNMDTVRIMTGISPHCFSWDLGPGEKFVTPQAVMSWSDQGTNGFSQNMHRFVNAHIVPRRFQNAERPVVLNNWEATFFDFNRSKILRMARQAKALGVEMFVLDDGWFGQRNSDKAGLGDWTVNEKKLPGGIAALSRDIHAMGLKFGLWFEPECVNPDSELYRAHPDWAVQLPGRKPCVGRNQLVLDLTRQEVRDYIVESVDAILSSANIEYVKWDYNRHISDMYSEQLANQGEFFHRWILGLYEIKRRLFREKHPNVLLEGCSSGGNRFDLGILCYASQIWTSDDTDAAERLDIQNGVYYFYPPSTVSCHVSMVPNQQTLRSVSLSSRFHVAAFGVLGYELDFGELTPEERHQIRDQIAFYKAHRKTFQYGTLYRYSPNDRRESWQTAGEGEILAAIFNRVYHAVPTRDCLKLLCAREDVLYSVETAEQKLRIGRFGGLIKHVSPVRIKADGAVMRYVDRHFSMKDGVEAYECSGQLLRAGLQLAMQYSGTGYDPSLRILGDWGSSMYVIREKK